MTKPSPATQAADMRALLEAVRSALTLPYDTPDYDRRVLDRAALARTVLDGALTEAPDDIAWNTGYLKRKLTLEEQDAADRDNNRCRRCRTPFDPTDTRFDGRARHGDTPWCRTCINNCHDGGTEHVCVICEPARYGGERR
ncbi:hypothetical protein [Streptomyces sp. A012304]|uniref:hypothetical protein n=1 Tax=Streptomyces sp. A012304 TaxID=375446 RepID=UPI00223117A4|nr:hypothetical protein [Streptomyces sp. A012304]GKQ37018.1 hypothetical protein ALMP_35570 [Streptomyces sp. A012304]